MSETFFLTGATGFVGRRLTKRLIESGNRVRCLARPTSNRERLAALGVEFVDGDVADVDSLRRGARGVDGVFHLAGLTREPRKNDFDRVNRLGVRNVASVCAEIGRESGRAPTLVSISSLAAAGPAPRNEIRAAKSPKIVEINAAGATFREFPNRLKRETDLPTPVSPYGRSKLGGEREALRFSNDVPTTIIRPPYVFGEGDAASIPLFRMANRLGIALIPGWIDRYFSFVDVDDLTQILIAAMERGERATPTSLDPTPKNPICCSGAGIYFATSPIPIRFSKFCDAMNLAPEKRRLKTIKIPPVGVLGAGVYGEIAKTISQKEPSLDWNKVVEALNGPWICSDEKSARHFKLKFETPLIEQVQKVARWYVREGLI